MTAQNTSLPTKHKKCADLKVKGKRYNRSCASHEGVCGRSAATVNLNLDTRWMPVVSFRDWPLWRRIKVPIAL